MLREIDDQLLVQAEVQQKDQSLTMIIAPVGVGSLMQGILSYYKAPSRTSIPPALMTVEPDTASTLHKSLKAGESLSISTSPTIMAGLECGTLSSIAWPLLKDGVDISTTISDWECHQAIEYMKNNGVFAGPCGGAALAGLRRLASDPKSKGALNKDSVVVCVCTEGTRPYTLPTPVDGLQLSLSDALMVLHMTPSVEPGWSMESIPVPAVLNYIAQWLEYRDVDISWVHYGNSDASLIAKLPSGGEIASGGKGKSLLLLKHMPSTTRWKVPEVYNSLVVTLLAVAQLRALAETVRGEISIAVVPNLIGLSQVLQSIEKPDAGLLLDTSLDFMPLPNVLVAVPSEFSETLKKSVRSSLGSEVPVMQVDSPLEYVDLLTENNIHIMPLGFLQRDLEENQGDEEADYMMAKALAQIGRDWCH